MEILLKKLLFYGLSVLITVIGINCIHVKVTLVHSSPEPIKVKAEHTAPYALRITNY